MSSDAKSRDKFYTKPEATQRLLSLVDLSQYDLIVEPSAGAGNISLLLRSVTLSPSLLLPHCLALDIEPDHPSVIKRDFLLTDHPEIHQAKKCLVIGNPPFGKMAGGAIAFFNRAASYESVKAIAFIVPKTFRKTSVINKLDSAFLLSTEVDIPDRSFTLEGRDHAVPCLIQVWHRSRLRRTPIPTPVLDSHYRFVKEEEAYRLTQEGTSVIVLTRVGGRAGTNNRIYDPSIKRLSQESHLFLVSDLNLNHIIAELNKIEWPHNTVGQRSVSKSEYTEELNQIASGR